MDIVRTPALKKSDDWRFANSPGDREITRAAGKGRRQEIWTSRPISGTGSNNHRADTDPLCGVG
ncbi:hypothetical protein IFM12276_03080 [Nocardia sputorum]|uniref:Uncharacterized protein n=1 Tax=Nocardia sputorum TaxID=2984338 RepID=A0ABM8CQN9_9NOCA|nr:hypothetical protein IFM12276_03080 [Nocardia sputorum]